MKLSLHFSLAEFTKSQTALRKGIANIPGPGEIDNLVRLALCVLEPVRREFGVGFSPTSGFRSLALNRVLESGDASQHIKGEAVDFEVPGFSNLVVAQWIRDNLRFDQLILEYHEPGDPNSGWIHVSLRDVTKNRGDVLTINSQGVWVGLLGKPSEAKLRVEEKPKPRKRKCARGKSILDYFRRNWL